MTDVLDLLASVTLHDDILVDHPYLEADDIAAALEYLMLNSHRQVPGV